MVDNSTCPTATLLLFLFEVSLSSNFIHSNTQRGISNNDNTFTTPYFVLGGTPTFYDLRPNEQGEFLTPNPFVPSGTNPLQTAELMTAWRGAPIVQPSLFIGGARDDVLQFEASRRSIERFAQTLPGLRGCHILDGAGHWLQRERADEVNALLLAFLDGLPPG